VSEVFTTGRENGRRRPRGYATWNPHAPTRALIDTVAEILDDYRGHLPLTVRQIFYRLVASYGYEKDEKAYKRLGEHLVRARRAHMVPFDAIRDDGVVIYSGTWHGGPDDFWDDTARRMHVYRRDRQAGQRLRLELWCEAAGMAPQLARVADHYSVPVYSSGGFASLTAVRLIAERALEREVPTVLLHVGDLDPSGESIFDALAQDAAAFVEADRVIETLTIESVRVALTAQQVSAHGLPTAPAKASDARSAGWNGGTCQLEALPPDVLAAIVRRAIEDRLDREGFEAEVDQECDDRQEILLGLPRGGEA